MHHFHKILSFAKVVRALEGCIESPLQLLYKTFLMFNGIIDFNFYQPWFGFSRLPWKQYTFSILDQLCDLQLDVNQIGIWLEHAIFQSWSYYQVSSRARKIRLCWIPGHFHFIQTWFPNFDFGLLQLFWNLTNDPDTASGMLHQFFEYSRPWTHSQLAPCLHEPICTNLLQNQRWRRHLESSSKEP